MYYTQALEKAGKMFDTQIYPVKNHSISGLDTRMHLYSRIIDFLDKNVPPTP
ncbi:hypothetical protein FACS1894177_08990 [Bacteroidia bacterium]|nr:hypothetical protein FACS1894177_08990 [Bacteroidia bacterium]